MPLGSWNRRRLLQSRTSHFNAFFSAASSCGMFCMNIPNLQLNCIRVVFFFFGRPCDDSYAIEFKLVCILLLCRCVCHGVRRNQRIAIMIAVRKLMFFPHFYPPSSSSSSFRITAVQSMLWLSNSACDAKKRQQINKTIKRVKIYARNVWFFALDILWLSRLGISETKHTNLNMWTNVARSPIGRFIRFIHTRIADTYTHTFILLTNSMNYILKITSSLCPNHKLLWCCRRTFDIIHTRTKEKTTTKLYTVGQKFPNECRVSSGVSRNYRLAGLFFFFLVCSSLSSI